MYCQIHRHQCYEICLEKRCQKPWGVCSLCKQQHHSKHQIAPSTEVYRKISELVKHQIKFQNDLKYELSDIIQKEQNRILSLVKKMIQDNVGQSLRNAVNASKYTGDPQIILAVKEYQQDGKFKDKYRNKLLQIDFSQNNLEYQKEVQRQIRQKEIYRIQSAYFNLLSSVKQAIQTPFSHSISKLQQTSTSLTKGRSFSSNSNYTTSSGSRNLSLYGRKRKKSSSKGGIFSLETTITTKQQKIKKAIGNKIRFKEEPKKLIDQSQDFLKVIQKRVASKIDYEKRGKAQNQMIIRLDDNQPKSLQVEQKVISENVYRPQIEPNIYQAKSESLSICQYQTNKVNQQKPNFSKLKYQNNTVISSNQISQFVLKQNRKPIERSSVKLLDNSKLQDHSRNITSLKKVSKITKRVSIVHNRQNQKQSIQQTIRLQEDNKQKFTSQIQNSFPPKLIQDVEARLKIVPEVNSFLKHNLPEIQQIWSQPNNICWKIYFQTKSILQTSEPRYSEQFKSTQMLKYSRSQIVQQLEFNIKNTNIKTISRPKNHLILQYLVKYSTQLVVLFQGTQIQNTKFSAEKYLNTLSNLAEGDVKGAFAYMNTNLVRLKQLI